MVNLRLYASPGSCSFAPHIVARESGLPLDLVIFNIREGFPEQYKHLNPKGKVPVLQIGEDTIITENIAIFTAISQLAPSKNLLGKTDLDIVRSYEWLSYISGTLHGQGFGGVFRPSRFSDDETTHDSIREKGKDNIRSAFEFIEEKLGGRKWAVGDAFTVIDAYLLTFYRLGKLVGISVEDFPNYATVVEEVSKRQSVKDAAEAEGITL